MIYISQDLIKLNDTSESIDSELQTLNKYFRAAQKEKHIEYVLNKALDESIYEVMGESNKRIGKRKEVKIKAKLLSKLRALYGEWANVMYFRVTHTGIKFVTNFERIYSTEHGRLYSGYRVGDGMLFTTHSLERFELRYVKFLPLLTAHLLMQSEYRRCATITSLDCLIYFAGAVKFFGISKWENDKDIYLHCYPKEDMGGVLVAQRYDDLFIIKTFLDEEMVAERGDITWTELNIKDRHQYHSVREYLLGQEGIQKIK